jgi:hypothetical protein
MYSIMLIHNSKSPSHYPIPPSQLYSRGEEVAKHFPLGVNLKGVQNKKEELKYVSKIEKYSTAVQFGFREEEGKLKISGFSVVTVGWEPF